MKKYLIKGLLALVVGGFTASCADKDGEYVPMDQQKATAYADAFKELIGGEVAPNHDWGFTKTSLVDETAETRAVTRTAYTNSNMWESDGLSVPAAITPREKEVVMNWFRTNENPRSETINIHNYFIQNVDYTDHTYNAYYQKDGRTETVTITNPGRSNMDYIFVGPGADGNGAFTSNDGDDHVNNFNANSGEIQYIKYSGSEWFGFHDSNGTGWSTSGHGEGKYCEKNRNFVIRFIDVDGVVGCYVGFNYESGKTTEGWHLEPDGFFDDRVIKLVAGEGTIVPSGGSTSTSTRTDRVERWRLVQQGRIFCEDLGTTDITTSDIDFNDAVFDAKLWRVGQFDVYYTNNESREGDYIAGLYNNEKENGKFKYVAEILLLAAGGTMPLKIGGDDGFEIHSKFGEGQEPSRTIGHTTIINTMGQPSQANFSTTVNTDNECKAVRVFVDVTKYVVEILNPEDPKISLDVIPIDVKWNTPDHQAVGKLTANYGDVPQKLCVPIGTRWVYERIPITPVKDENNNVVKDGAYLKFADYAKTRSPLFWNEGNIEDLLYPAIPEGMTPEAICTNEIGSNSYKDYITTGETTTEVETVLWEGELAFAENTNGSDFTPSTLSFNKGDYIRIYGSTTNSSNNRVQIAFVDNTTKGWLTKKPYDQTNVNFTNGYVEGTLDATDISNLAGVTKFGVWGINVTITKISKVVKTRTTN